MDLGKQYSNIPLSFENDLWSGVDRYSLTQEELSIDLIRRLSAHGRREGVPSERHIESLFKSNLAAVHFCPVGRRISTGLPSLDTQLKGGIVQGKLTEVFGASGTGKSQLLMKMAINAQNVQDQGQDKGHVVYISTEAPLETRRLIELASGDASVLNNISCIYCPDMENQDHILFTQLQAKLEKLSEEERRITAVVIDSISHHLRPDDSFLNASVYLRTDLLEQSNVLFEDPLYRENRRVIEMMISKSFNSDKSHQKRAAKSLYLLGLYRHLSDMAKKFNIAVIIANQVSDMVIAEGDLQRLERDEPLEFSFQCPKFYGWDINAHHEVACHGTSQTDNEDPSAKHKRADTSHEDSGLLWCQTSEKPFVGATASPMPSMKAPALGYLWSKLVSDRILLWKSYTPFEPESPASESHHNQSESLWQISRFTKVLSGNACAGGTSRVVQFEIAEASFVEVPT